MRLAFFSVVYPAILPYLPDFFRSLEAQTRQDFDLLLINGGIQEANATLHAMTPLPFSLVDAAGPIAKVREQGINALIERGYDAVLFGDADDWFAPNRIEVCVQLLQTCDIVVNDLHLAADPQSVFAHFFFSRTLADQTPIDAETVFSRNLLGLSNTALKLSNVAPVKFDPSLIAVDWFFFTTLLAQGKRALFTNQTATFYRQYPGNLIGLKQADRAAIERGLAVKLAHYRNLAFLGPRYRQAYDYFKEIASGDDIKNRFIDACLQHSAPDQWWWENIRSDFEINR